MHKKGSTRIQRNTKRQRNDFLVPLPSDCRKTQGAHERTSGHSYSNRGRRRVRQPRALILRPESAGFQQNLGRGEGACFPARQLVKTYFGTNGRRNRTDSALFFRDGSLERYSRSANFPRMNFSANAASRSINCSSPPPDKSRHTLISWPTWPPIFKKGSITMRPV